MGILTSTNINLKNLLGNFQKDFTAFFRQEAEDLINTLLKDEIENFFLQSLEERQGDIKNGFYSRTVLSDLGPLNLRIPRDRFDLFKTQILKPYQRRLESVDEMIQTLYFKGMSENEIVDQITYQLDGKISRETIRKTINKTLSKAIEFNSREILMNSENSAFIIIADICERYNRQSRLIKNISEMEENEREQYFDNSIA